MVTGCVGSCIAVCAIDLAPDADTLITLLSVTGSGCSGSAIEVTVAAAVAPGIVVAVTAVAPGDANGEGAGTVGAAAFPGGFSVVDTGGGTSPSVVAMMMQDRLTQAFFNLPGPP